MTAPQQPIDAPEAWSTPEQRERMLEQMRAVASGFYMQAVRIGCHPFIEFAGLMNEYIKCCGEAHKQGIDFTRCNTHTGHHLPMRPFEVKYVNEKLECIFTGRSVMDCDRIEELERLLYLRGNAGNAEYEAQVKRALER
jgi:hypothetical protein